MVLLFMNVVMLNLLVAIISEAFGRINSSAVEAMYQERAAIISENKYLIPESRRRDHCRDKDLYLLIGTDVTEQDVDNSKEEV